ncbi:MAG: MBL fold metallo-hydrolase [Lentisphaerae bacterium]|nr:MBL fold metallo-hydrolase [Lentisphaerota bacterium]
MDDQTVFLSSLGSGSSGNAFFVESPEGAILIDQGFSRKELLARMEKCGCDPHKLKGALLTHEHSDHSCGARVFCDTFNLPLYATPETTARLTVSGNLPKTVRTFEPGAVFPLAGFNITSFALSHDVETVGFKLQCRELQIGIATDLGIVSESVKRHLRNCHALVIESNYDREMLMNSQRRLELKRRILGFRGHLGNLDTAELLAELLCNDSKLLLLAHVSRECNDYGKLEELCSSRLKELQKEHCLFRVLRQDEPSERFAISAV